jgi:hypothetical protein
MWLIIGLMLIGTAAILAVLKRQSIIDYKNQKWEEAQRLLPRYTDELNTNSYFEPIDPVPVPPQVLTPSQPAKPSASRVANGRDVAGEARAQKLLAEHNTNSYRRSLGTYL